VRSLDNTLHGLQFISPDGSKKFKTGTVKQGHFHLIGKPVDSTMIICEGYATGASIHQATGHAVLVAFDAGNLKPVAESIHKQRPQLKMIIAADDDHATDGNPGLTKATEAARAVGGSLASPSFPVGRGPKDSDFNDLARLAGLGPARVCIESAVMVEPIAPPAPAVEDPAPQTEGTEPDRKPLFVSASTFFDEDITPAYLVDKRIEEDCDVQVVGPSGEGKTFVVIGLCCATVTGGHTLGGFRCKKGAVLYLAGEGHRGIRRRVRAWAKHAAMTADDMKHLQVSSGTISFDGCGLHEAIAEAKRVEELHGEPVRLIVIDTMARHMVGEENSAKDTGDFIRDLKTLRESFPGSVALVVHHTGHGEDTKGRGRGSSAIPAAMDTIIVCNKGELTFTKQKDGEIPPPVLFKLLPVQIGTDADGEPVTSCIVEYGERSAKHRAPVFTGQEKIVVRLLEEAGAAGILIGDLRQAFYNCRQTLDPEVKTNTMKNAFLKAIASLSEKQAISQDQHLITMIKYEPSPVTSPSFCSQHDGERPSVTSPSLKGGDEVTLSGVMTLSEADFDFDEIPA
jgi:putative DNA primase/helicase